jgi:hypothetical protein
LAGKILPTIKKYFMKLKAFIIMFNRLTWPILLAKQLNDFGCEVILLDNGSTYKPLLDWYKQCSYKVISLSHIVSEWDELLKLIYQIFNDRFFIISDPDIDISSVPNNFKDVLFLGLNQHNILKCGLSLSIIDLPKNSYTDKIINHESKFWKIKTKYGFYKSDISTTLALYDMKKYKSNNFLSAVRAPIPYTAKHLPWYLTKETISTEEIFYIESTKKNNWSKYLMLL